MFEFSKEPDVLATKEMLSLMEADLLYEERTLLNYIGFLNRNSDEFSNTEMVKIISNVYSFNSSRLRQALRPFIRIAEIRSFETIH